MSERNRLEGKVGIVTGTSRGVGVGISRRLLEVGATFVGSSRRNLRAARSMAMNLMPERIER